MTVQEEYEKIKARIEQQVKYGLPETPSAQPSKATEAPESGWRTTEDGIKYRTLTVSELFDENADLGKAKLLEKIERENKSLVGIRYQAGSQAEKKAQERAAYASNFLNTQLVEFIKDGKTYYQTPRGEQIGKSEFLRVMKATGTGISGQAGGSYNPSATYMALTGEGLEGRTEKDKARVTITQMNKVMHALSPVSAGLEAEYAEIEERNIEHELGENVIRLDTGEYVPESQWYSLSAADQEILKSQGVEAFNNVIAQRIADYEGQVKTFLEETGGNFDYWKGLTPEKQKDYLEQSGWQPVKTEAGTQVGYSYDISRGETAEKYAQWKRGEITEQQWMDYVEGVEKRAAGFVIPPSPIHIENFITSYGGNVIEYNSLVDSQGNPDIDARNLYLERLSQGSYQKHQDTLQEYVNNGKISVDESGNYQLYNLTTQDLQDTKLVTALVNLFGTDTTGKKVDIVGEIRQYAEAKETLKPYAVYDESGNLTGYDYSKISREQVTPAVISAVNIMTPDVDVDTLGATYVDVDELNRGIRKAVDIHNMITSGSSPYDAELFLVPAGVPTDLSMQKTVLAQYSDVIPTAQTYVIARKALPLSDYILQEASFKPSMLEPKSFQKMYYPTITATEYSRAIEGKGYSADWLATRGAVIKPTISETVRMLAGVDPDMTKELSGIDKAKLFGYGFVNTLAIEAAIALPFVASPAAVTGLGLVSMAPTAMNWSRMSAGERRTALIVDGLFSVLIFGAPILRTLSYIPRELRSIFGDIGSATLLNKVTILNTALKAVEGVSQVTQTQRIVRAATDLKNLLIAAKDNGVQGLDRLIEQVEMIRKNPQLFKGIGDMNLTPELENILKQAETALKQVELGTYKPFATRIATEGTRAEVASRQAVYEGSRVDWDNIVKSYSLRTEEEASRFSAANRELIGLDITESLTQISEPPIVTSKVAEMARLRVWLREEDATRIVNNINQAIEKSAQQSSKYWTENRTQVIYQDLVDQYAAMEKAQQPAREALMQEARMIAANESSVIMETAVALQKESIAIKLNQIANILADADTLSPNATTFLLINSGLGALALTVAPSKVLNIVRQSSLDLRTQFINSVGLSNKTVLGQVINDYDESEAKINQIQDLAETATINQVSITQEDLTEIIAVPKSETIEYRTIEEIIAQPMGEQIIGVPSGEITTPEIVSPTEAPIPLIKAQEWEAPSVIEITKIPEEMKDDIEEWGVPSPEELSLTYRFDEIGVPDISEISFKELTNLDRVIKKVEFDWPTFDKATYMRMMLMQMAQNAENQEAVNVSDLPFEQRKYIEEELKRKARQKGRSIINIPFILPLMLLVDAPLVINGIKTLPSNLKMSLLQTLPDTRESEIVREGIETELSPQLIEQIEEAAKDIWEKQLEEIVKGDIITSPSQLEIEIEEAIRRLKEDYPIELPTPEELEQTVRKLIEYPIPIGKTVETPEIVTIPQITPMVTPQAVPATTPELMPLTRTLTETMTEVLSKTELGIQGLTQSQIQALTQTQVQNLTQAQIQNLTNAQIQALTNTQIQSLTQQQIQALTQSQIQALTQTQIQALTQQQVQSLTETQIESLTETQVKALTDTQIEAMTETQIKILTETKPDIFNKPPTDIPPTRIPPRKIIKPPIIGSDGKELTKEQLEGAIGWKQGIMYKYIYPPYGQEDIINSRSPIQGIPMKEGIRSAYETIIRTRPGFIPPNITRHMGMMDIQITDADKNGQPEIKFMEREHRKGRGSVKKQSTAQVFTIGT